MVLGVSVAHALGFCRRSVSSAPDKAFSGGHDGNIYERILVTSFDLLGGGVGAALPVGQQVMPNRVTAITGSCHDGLVDIEQARRVLSRDRLPRFVREARTEWQRNRLTSARPNLRGPVKVSCNLEAS